jgi:predicted DsbA family dithiol-disulfide isomerase
MRVDIWSDVACPWCYIGKRRFEEGLRRYSATSGSRAVEVEYHSFELAPHTPVDFAGSEIDYLVSHLRLSEEQASGMLERITALAAAEGLAYDFTSLQHTRTLKAHQLLHLAAAHGLQEPMKERLLSAYFVEGRHIGHDDVLAELAAEVGLDRQAVLDALRDGTYAEAVDADLRQARAYGITGVPFYVIDRRLAVSGAQEPDVFARALAQAAG